MSELGKLKEKVRAVLLDEWDPIGILDAPAVSDEYDSYAAHVGEMLVSKKSAIEISDYLSGVETQLMELHPNKDRALSLAGKLVDISRENT